MLGYRFSVLKMYFQRFKYFLPHHIHQLNPVPVPPRKHTLMDVDVANLFAAIAFLIVEFVRLL